MIGAIDPAGIAETTALVKQLPTEVVAARHCHSAPHNRMLLELAGLIGRSFQATSTTYRDADDPVILDGLDNRTRTFEELTKFLSTPLGVITIMARTGARSAALARSLRLFLGGPGGHAAVQWSALRKAIWNAGQGRRVPPRVYLTRQGHALTSLQASPIGRSVGNRRQLVDLDMGHLRTDQFT